MYVSFGDIDMLLRRSTEGPDNPIGILISGFALLYAACAVVLLCAGLYGLLTRKRK